MVNQAAVQAAMTKAKMNRVVEFIQIVSHMQLAKVGNAVMIKLTILTTWNAVAEMNSCRLVHAKTNQNPGGPPTQLDILVT